MKRLIKNKFRLIFLFAFLLRFFLLFTPPHIDVYNHIDWGTKFWEYGPKNFYEQIFWGVSWPNQPLGSVLFFALIAKLKFWIFQFLWQLNLTFVAFPSFIFPFLEKNLHPILLKLPFALSDLGIGFLIYKIIMNLSKKEKPALLATSIFLFNPALIYNSTVWGQTDSLVNLLALLGLWLLGRDKFSSGWFFYFASLYFKLSLIIFLPLFILLVWQKRKHWLKIAISLCATVAFCLLITLPFVHHGNVITWLWYLYTNRILPRQGDMLSGNAFNLWTLFYGVDLSLKESFVILGATAKFWGRILFLLPSGLATIFLVLKKKKLEFFDYLWLGVIYAFCAFLFLTNMHERYLYPIFPLLAILVVQEKKLLHLFLPLSVIHLANLYHLWWYPRSEIIVSLFSAYAHLLPRILSLANLGLFLLSFKWFVTYEKKLA